MMEFQQLKTMFMKFDLLALLSVAFIYAILLFSGVIENLITSDQIAAADIRTANLFSTFRDAEFVKNFFWITILGKFDVVLGLSIILTIVLFLRKQKKDALGLWIMLIGSEVFNLLSKFALHRQRPGGGLYIENSFAFPSGHAARAMALYGFIAFILFRSVRRQGSQVGILLAAAIIILAIGFSRLYLGVHFLSDVLGGYALGLLWLGVGISVLLRSNRLPDDTLRRRQ